jgi:PAS domain S-box-containing protein
VRDIDVAAELPDLLPDPVLGCDGDGAIVYWSPAAEQAYGYAADEALGRRAATLLQTRFPLPLLEITEELDDLGRWEGRLEHRCKDGRTVSVHSRWVARRDDRGARVGSVRIDRELPEGATTPPPWDSPGPAQAGRSPADAGPQPAPHALAHELNNALAIIINYSAFVAAELEAPHGEPTDQARRSMRADLHEVQTAAERALELLRRLG